MSLERLEFQGRDLPNQKAPTPLANCVWPEGTVLWTGSVGQNALDVEICCGMIPWDVSLFDMMTDNSLAQCKDSASAKLAYHSA